MSKDIILHSGREYGENIHAEIKTFSLVTSPEMAPGFHILVYTKIGNGQGLYSFGFFRSALRSRLRRFGSALRSTPKVIRVNSD